MNFSEYMRMKDVLSELQVDSDKIDRVVYCGTGNWLVIAIKKMDGVPPRSFVSTAKGTLVSFTTICS